MNSPPFFQTLSRHQKDNKMKGEKKGNEKSY